MAGVVGPRFVVPSYVTDGLVGHWDAGDASSYPGSGTDWFDLTANANDGVLFGSPAYDGSSGAVVFNGSSQYMSVAKSASLNFGSGGFCLIAWIYPISVNNCRLINDRGTGGSGALTGYQFKISQLGSEWYFVDCAVRDGTNTNAYANTVIRYNLNSWYCVAMNYTAQTKVDYYVNNTLNGSDASNMPTGNIDNALPVGLAAAVSANGVPGIPSQFFGGQIAIVSIYNRDLSAAELTQNFDAFRLRFGI